LEVRFLHCFQRYSHTNETPDVLAILGPIIKALLVDVSHLIGIVLAFVGALVGELPRDILSIVASLMSIKGKTSHIPKVHP
jgi:hypothetical protein